MSVRRSVCGVGAKGAKFAFQDLAKHSLALSFWYQFDEEWRLFELDPLVCFSLRTGAQDHFILCTPLAM